MHTLFFFLLYYLSVENPKKHAKEESDGTKKHKIKAETKVRLFRFIITKERINHVPTPTEAAVSYKNDNLDWHLHQKVLGF